MGTPFFEMRHVSKYFAKVIANKDVSLSVQRGEVLALLGENGAGKSTIMKILYGLYSLDEGSILMDGKEQKIGSPKDAMALGISMIQQHFSLVPAHTVTENIMLGNVRGRIDYRKCEREIESLSKKYGLDIPVRAKVRDLDVGTRQKLEILKALYLDAKLLIMDEPTAVLTPQESDKLMEFVKGYTVRGNAVIFITHKLKEVMEVADRIVVMRNGRVCGSLKAADTSEAELSRLMIGTDLKPPQKEAETCAAQKPVRLSLQKVTADRKGEGAVLRDISFEIRQGEIFGIAGVSGNGQEELCEAICGALPISSGAITLNGQEIAADSICRRISAGIGYLPVDRHRDAMIADMTLAENIMLKESFGGRWTSWGLIDKKSLDAYTAGIIDAYKVKATGPGDLAGGLSGGNQQKVALAREVSVGSQLLILNQPTRGLDLGAINNIHTIMFEERAKGKSILLISTELSEIFKMCDRIAVMYKGTLMGVYNSDALNTEKIGLLMAGYKEVAGECAQKPEI